MAQDTTPAIICYQGDGSQTAFPVPFDKGYYGDVKVLFVRRGLADYTYYPSEDNYTVNGRLYAWANGSNKVYTHTPNPAVGAETYNNFDEDTGDTVSDIAGQTITVDSVVYSRAVQHDIANNLILTWTGDMLEVGDFICIIRDTERGQPYIMPNNQKHIEGALDNLARQIQEVKDATDNALKIDPSHDIPDSHKMNPIDWLKSIIRCMDFSVRAVRLADGWFDYSTDDPNIADADKTWTHLLNTDNIKAIRERSEIIDNETVYWTEYQASDGSWKTLSDPHKWDNMKLSDLADTDFTNLSAGNFIMFDGLKWKNVYSSATASWGTILGTITDQTDLMAEFAKYVRTDGSSTMTNPLMMRATDDFKCAIAPYWDGVGFFKLNDNNSVTLMASIEYNSGFEPATTNTYDIGALTRKWKNLYLSGKAYMSVINNGYDIAVPVTSQADTFALMSDVALVANSGTQLYTTGVWYAKMYAASTVPTGAEYDGRNYADFSQVDSDNNPIIVIYEGQSGAWVELTRITPPANYNGYITVTSKIWDIAEQSGQQGGQVLWSHSAKTFTPYPRIISFDGASITLSSLTNCTVVMPYTITRSSAVNAGYVIDRQNTQDISDETFVASAMTISLTDDKSIYFVDATDDTQITIDTSGVSVVAGVAKTFEIHIVSGATLPVITWSGISNWLIDSVTTPAEINTTSIFAIRVQQRPSDANASVVANYGGAY